MRPYSRVLLVAAGFSLVVGFGDVAWKVVRHLLHPAWSAPAYVEVVNFVPYAAAAAVLVGWWAWLNRTATS